MQSLQGAVGRTCTSPRVPVTSMTIARLGIRTLAAVAASAVGVLRFSESLRASWRTCFAPRWGQKRSLLPSCLARLLTCVHTDDSRTSVYKLQACCGSLTACS